MYKRLGSPKEIKLKFSASLIHSSCRIFRETPSPKPAHIPSQFQTDFVNRFFKRMSFTKNLSLYTRMNEENFFSYFTNRIGCHFLWIGVFDFEKSGGLGRISATLGRRTSACSFGASDDGTAILDIVIGAFCLLTFCRGLHLCWLCPPHCHIDS